MYLGVPTTKPIRVSSSPVVWAAPGDAEVGQPGVALRQEDVLRLDVAVDHVAGVGVLQGLGDLAGDPDGVADRQAAFAAEPLAE